ncbi:MAG TPA: hypothetical protein ENI62_14440 [Gammaproteobacteria bacterium]|nr:hypothetical protein [Gammaproteobacteria bacterium]
MSNAGFSWKQFIMRLLAALALVFVTYNPTGQSYYHWAIVPLPEYDVPRIFAGIVLIIGWAVFLRATFHSLGVIGIVLAVAFFGTLLWLLIDRELIQFHGNGILSYLVLVAIAGVLAVGMSWSHIRRRMSGQLDVSDDE